jgi:hypothetical protein
MREVGDNTLWLVAILGAVFIVLSVVTATFYYESVLPVRMAEKGYCQQVVIGMTSLQWVPCSHIQR